MEKTSSLAQLSALVLSPPMTPTNSPCDENESSISSCQTTISVRSSPPHSSPLAPAQNISPISQCPELLDPTQRLSEPTVEALYEQAVLQFNNDILKDFYHRTRHNQRLFRLSADSMKTIRNSSLSEISRAMSWWAIVGRMKLNGLIRKEYRKEQVPAIKQQAFMDISKAFWIVQEALQLENASPQLGELPCMQQCDMESLKYFFITCLDALVHIQESIWSMQRHGVISEDTEDAILHPGVDTLIWISCPTPKLDINYLLTGHHHHLSTSNANENNTWATFPLGDDQKSFHYDDLQVDVFLFTSNSNTHQVKYRSILSIRRIRGERNLIASIGTQDGHLTFSITGNEDLQLSWNDIVWVPGIHAFEIRLKTGFRLHIRCTAPDFRRFRDIYLYHRRSNALFESNENEILIFESKLKTTEYIRTEGQMTRFPVGSIPDCTVRIFERVITSIEGTGPRRHHQGYRIAILTPLSTKHMNIFTEIIPPEKPTQFGFLRGDTGNPVLSLKFTSATLILGFLEPQERTALLAHLSGCFLYNNEAVLANTQINRVSLDTASQSIPAQLFDSFQWQSIKVLNETTSRPNIENNKTVLSDSLRIVIDSPIGRITDRLNVGIGELKIRRNVIASGHELQILREPQQDLTITLADPVDQETAKNMTIALENLKTSSSIRTYSFVNLSELHSFQSAITGFSILFDGTPSIFSISRRRMMVPVYKEWSSPHTRIQILRRGRQVQLAAFFEGFTRGKCMNFVLKDTEVFIKSKKNGVDLIRIVDAKFALPSGGKNDCGYGAGFACLDFLEYPAEHDDITIGFESSIDFERFSKALPHVVKES